ncbi:MAG TPA: hypothetical protein VM242_02720 [Acidimicrobiales bacterium]|jgi:uncharacterized protein YjbJ (UPF0337 family)|nr:hypothetical protein [Acidimicrobiales bacterium]
MGDDATRVKGKIEEAVGWATGDREAEAKGRVEGETGSAPSEDEVDRREDEVREDHGDI